MSSIIPGYEYDIFISYRQKDNRGEKWVSEFVNALKSELDSAFKEDISVYFDINPHDGLLETHEVADSLKEKLKCLIFIPIISRTYCDPKSFAWEHEFVAFVENAKRNKLGLKIKLPNGNVASRVLPVRIYDLDNEDIRLCESVTGGVLRGIDFIYSSPGVNRPLRIVEDNPDDNIHKTYYRDQINKVANSVKEIIAALGQKQQPPDAESQAEEILQPVSLPVKGSRTKVVAGALLLMILLFVGFSLVPKIVRSKKQVEKSIAVLPFNLLSDKPEEQYLADGMMEAITLHLSKIKDLRVMDRTSVEQYRETKKTTRTIGKELDVGYLLEGSFLKYGDDAKLTVKLINVSEERLNWEDEYNIKWKDVFSLQSKIAQSIGRELHAVITPEEKETITKIPTTSLTAYDFYQRGRDEYMKYLLDNENREALDKAEEFYKKSLQYDSTFARGYTGLAEVYWDKNYSKEFFSEKFMEPAIILADKALYYDNQLPEAFTIRGRYYYETGKSEVALMELDKALKFNPNYWEAYFVKGEIYLLLAEEMDEAIVCLKKASQLHRGSQLSEILYKYAWAFQWAGLMDMADQYIREAVKLDGDSATYFVSLGTSERYLGNYNECIAYYEKALKFDSLRLTILMNLGEACGINGDRVKSLKYIKKYIDRLNALGLIQVNESHRKGYAYWLNGFTEEAEYYFDEQKKYCEESIKLNRSYARNYYAYYDLAAVYAFRGDKENALANLRIFNQRNRMPLWIPTLINLDPLFNNLRNEQEFKNIAREVEAKYITEHERIRIWMEENGIN